MAQRYKPLFKLDSGGMAEVYVAEAVAMKGFKKRVAIKRILPGLLSEERFVRMFLDEARLSLRLNHANVVSVSDIGQTDQTYFIVMEYVEGTTLKSLLEYHQETKRAIPVPLAIWITHEILKGLQYAHNLRDGETGRNMGIVHRDISPPNILVSWNAEVKITDFGLAKATTQLEVTDQGVVKGKFSYLSPEAAQGQAVDHRTDIFAVGILLYEMLTLRRLFTGESDWDTIQRVRAAQVPSVRAINSDVPPELERILRKSLARDLADRYQSATEFADDLVEVLFDLRMRVSARDLEKDLAVLREHKSSQSSRPKPVSSGSPLVLDLLNDELTQFRSLDSQSANAGGDANQQAVPVMMGNEAFDPSAPLKLEISSPDLDVMQQPAAARVSPPTPLSSLTPLPSAVDAPLPLEKKVEKPQQSRKKGTALADRKLHPGWLIGILIAAVASVVAGIFFLKDF